VEEKAKSVANNLLKQHRPLGLPKDLNEQLRKMFPEIRP
jgi:hypothetical protein